MLHQEWLLRHCSSWEKDRIVITPFTRANLKDHSYTFTLSSRVVTYDPGQVLDVRDAPPIAHESAMDREGGLIVAPGGFLLCHTEETLRLPDGIACLLSTHPSAAKFGIDFLQTSTFIPPGSECRITLETSNRGPCPVRLYPGMKAVKAIFLSVG